MKKLIVPILLAAAAFFGWIAGSRHAHPVPIPAEGRRIIRYQSPMHPWIRSDQPGQCTICGMDLVPVYEGDAGSPASSDLVVLGSNSVHVVDVQTSAVRRQPLRRTLRAAGTLQDDATRKRMISAYVEGRLDRLFVNYDGAEVVEGQPLALVFSPVLLGAIREYLTLGRDLGADAPLARSAARRLVQYGLSDQQIARLPSTFTETNLHVELSAPMSGTVVNRRVIAGQSVTQGQELFELADYSTLWFEFIAYEQDLPWLAPGLTVEVSFPSLPGRRFTNSITFIQPSLDETTRSTRARVPLENPVVEADGHPRRLLQRLLFGTADIHTVFPNVLTVPRSAVLDPGGRPLVFVELASGHYQPRPVRTGRSGDSDIEVLEGVSEGDRVVTSGALLLDAQAQLNTAANPAAAAEASMPATATELSPVQRDALRALTTTATLLSSALAADDLAAFNAALPPLASQVATVSASLAGVADWEPRLVPLMSASRLEAASNLVAARREFNRFMEAMVPVGQRLRGTDPEFARLKVYRCPMTRKSFPGAPPRAEWLQWNGPLRNPYFGAEMPDCGTEVAP